MPLTPPALTLKTYPDFVGNLAAIVEGPAKRNFIRNGDFQIAQRGTSFAGITTEQYTLDGWRAGAAGTNTVTQEAFTVGQTDVPGNPVNFIQVNRTVAAGAANDVLSHRIEFPARLSGKTARVSFYVKASTGSKALVFDLASSGVTSAIDTSDNAFTATTAWTLVEASIAVPAMTAATSSAYLALRIREAASFGTFTLQVADVQLEEGSLTSRFERLNIEDQRAWCQRFLPAMASTSTGHPFASGMNFSTTQSVFVVRFLARARAAITGASVSAVGHFSVAKSDSTLQVCTGLAFNRGGDEACELVSTVASGLTAGNASNLYATNASGTIVFTGAEL